MTRPDTGFSLLEVLIAVALVAGVLSATLALLNPNVTLASAWPEPIDAQQRARAGLEAIVRELHLAGAGIDAGPASGPLSRYLPAVLPRRLGRVGADAPDVARPDLVTVIYVPVTTHQTTLAADLASPAGILSVRHWPSCPRSALLCGIRPGQSLLVFDRLGNFDAMDVTSVSGDLGQVAHRRPSSANPAYLEGDAIAEVSVRTLYFDRDNLQLRRFDGDETDVPVIDHVVDLRFEYFGDPAPPRHPRPPVGVGNCLYDAGGTLLPAPYLVPDGGSLAPLPLAMLRDGPWCGSGDHRFDADLLRVRRLRVTLRVQVPNDMRRGRSSAFAVGGRGTSALRLAPDYTVTTDVTPRNLNLGR